MKVQRKAAMVILLAAILVLPPVLHAQETDPVSVVMAEAERVNAGDLDGVMELYTDDVVLTMVMGPNTDILTGKEEVRPWAAGLIAENFRMEYEVVGVEGNTVTTTARTSSDSINALGVAPLVATTVHIVQDGKIQAWTWTLSEESLAAYGAALAALPETGGEALPVQAIVGLLGGLAVAGGLVLEGLRRRTRQAR